MKSVALVGFSQKTMELCKQSKADEIWSLNHIFIIHADKVPRCDRLFEIHKKDWFLRKEIPATVAYYEWLKQPHDFPIYTQEEFPEIPSAVVYPFEEVVRDIFPNLKRLSGDELQQAAPYFTCTFSFMMALAIHEKFDRIELYGFDMETNTDYGYQKPGAEFMIGIALGRGIEVVLPKTSSLCNSMIYAYDAIPFIGIERLRELLDIYKEQYEAVNTLHLADVERYQNAPNEENFEAYRSSGIVRAAYIGAVQALEKLIGMDSYYTSRQQLEFYMRDYHISSEYWKAIANGRNSLYVDAYRRGDKERYEKLWEEYLQSRANAFCNIGAKMLIEKLISECDMQAVEHKLEVDIVTENEIDEQLEEQVEMQ